MSLSILIVNWNSKEFLRSCLRSIKEHCSGLNPQVVVVDGASFDGCDAMLASEFPSVEFVQSPENIGFGRCNNLGFSRVSGEYVLLLNPDTEVQPDAVQILLAALKELPAAGLVCPRLLLPDGSLQDSSVMAFPTPLNQALDSQFLRRIFPGSSLWNVARAYANTGPTPVEAVSGACMLLRSETYRRLGGFNPAFFMYAEDLDICLQVHRAGLHVYHVPAARVLHHGGGSSATQFSKFATVLQREALRIYFRLNHGRLAAAGYRFGMFLSGLVRLAILVIGIPLARSDTRPARIASFKKWATVLSWCLGFEKWAVGYRVAASGSKLGTAADSSNLRRCSGPVA